MLSYQFFKCDERGNITHVRAWIAYLLLAAVYVVVLGSVGLFILLFVKSILRLLE